MEGTSTVSGTTGAAFNVGEVGLIVVEAGAGRSAGEGAGLPGGAAGEGSAGLSEGVGAL